jgi:hypothetical protein
MLLAVEGSGEDDEDDFERPSVDADSSDKDWLPDYEDIIESSDDDFDVDFVRSCAEEDAGLVNWCMHPEAFTLVHFDMAQLAQYYRLLSWSSASVDFVRSRDNFTRPTPGLRFCHPDWIPKPEIVFNMYWTKETIIRIVVETNRYAHAPLP